MKTFAINLFKLYHFKHQQIIHRTFSITTRMAIDFGNKVMQQISLTTVQALIKFLSAQKIEINGKAESLFGCAFAIFGHGNVTCLGQQLYENQRLIPVWRGQNEQSMAFAAIAYAKAQKRQRIGIVTSSIGPGATNMVTAAGVAHTNRLPLLLISGDAYVSRLPDPVLQQTEHFNNPSITVNDCFQVVTRYWDRINAPEQLLQSLPQAIATLLDPADCGPVFLGLPQDIQGRVTDYPIAFFAETLHRIRRPQAESVEVTNAVELITKASKPLIISGGGVHYSKATATLQRFAEKHQIPVLETVAGRCSLLAEDKLNCGPIGSTGSDSAKALTAVADVVIAVGTRLQDFVTGSWSTFKNPHMCLITINVARHDAIKHRATTIMADARDSLEQLSEQLDDYQSPANWLQFAEEEKQAWESIVASRIAFTATELPSYAQLIGRVNELADANDRVMTAAGGLPAELNMNWRALSIGNFDIEFGFSCMGYEIAGAWGAKMATPNNEVIVMVGDGSYLLLNSDLYSSVLTGHKIIVIVCDNGGFAVIDKLQNNTGNKSFNNFLRDCTHQRKKSELPRVNFVQHAQSLGAAAEKINNLRDFADAFQRAKQSDISYVLVFDIDPYQWSSVDTWWEVGLPEKSQRKQVKEAVTQWQQGRLSQRRGI